MATAKKTVALRNAEKRIEELEKKLKDVESRYAMTNQFADRPLTVEQAAEYTGYTKSYLYKLAFQKKIPHYKPGGGRILFSLTDLKAFCFRNRSAADYELQEQADAILNSRGAVRAAFCQGSE